MGDVKLAALVGLILAYRSWTVLFGGTLMGFLLGAVASVLVLASRRGNRKSSIPFGPFMLSGALIAIMLG
jgi:leader peptidase (prepilin peptidase)/N-methyltransferase